MPNGVEKCRPFLYILWIAFCSDTRYSYFTVKKLTIKEFYNITDAAKFVDGVHTCILRCCNGSVLCYKGYIWRYKGDPLGDISNINPRNLDLNYLVQYSLEGERLAEYSTAKAAAEAVGKKSASNLSSVIRGDQKTFGGYLWQIEPKFVYFNHTLFNNVYKRMDKDNSKIHTNHIIKCFDLEDNLVEEFKSMLDAAQKIYNKDYYRRYISDCCNGLRKQWKGYKWKKVSINPSNSENELIESTQS